jgi:hypothetical protein
MMAMVRQGKPEKRDCQFCLVIRIGGGYIVLGYGDKCHGCGNHIDVSLGKPTITRKKLEVIAEEALGEVGDELIEEVIREMEFEIAEAALEKMDPIQIVVETKIKGKEWKAKAMESKAVRVAEEERKDAIIAPIVQVAQTKAIAHKMKVDIQGKMAAKVCSPTLVLSFCLALVFLSAGFFVVSCAACAASIERLRLQVRVY